MNQKKPLSGNHLKLIACAAMFADHACRALISGTALSGYLCGTVGRIAFPIFAFLVMEGFLHTRSRKKYALNLLIFACISEIFFDMALYKKWLYPGAQNTCFTLLLGLLLMICLEKCEETGKRLLLLPVSAGFACVFLFARVDYGLAAFCIFLILYFCRYQAPWFTGLLISTVLIIGYSTPGALLSIIPLYFYSRKRGTAPPAAKYLFYIFYPAHLAALILIRMLL